LIYLYGVPITRKELANRTGRSQDNIANLLDSGLSPEQILVAPKWRKLDQVLDGKPCTVKDIEDAAGLCHSYVVKMLAEGMSSDDIVAKAKRGLIGTPRKPRLISVFGVDMTIREIATAFNIAESSVRVRLKGGLSPDRPDFHRVKRGGDSRGRDTYYRREVSPGVYECGCRWDRQPGRSEVLVECPLHAGATATLVFDSAKEA
jgi:hypothetical protein